MSEEAEDRAGDNVADDWAAALSEQAAASTPQPSAPAREPAAPAKSPAAKPPGRGYAPAKLQDLVEDPQAGDAPDVNLDVILDIPVTISMEIGRSKITIRNLLQLNQGSVVELDRLAGEPMDVLVNQTLIAHGEVVVVNEKFGIRLTDVISPAERVKKLK